MIIKSILVPIDGSKHAEKALTYALDVAEMHKADVEIITVVPEIETSPDWVKEYTEKTKENNEKMLSETLKKAQDYKPKINIRARLEEGVIDLKILEIAKKENHDLIIMGSRGLGSIKGFLLGSISNKIVNLAEIPVLIVK